MIGLLIHTIMFAFALVITLLIYINLKRMNTKQYVPEAIVVGLLILLLLNFWLWAAFGFILAFLVFVRTFMVKQ